MENESEKQVLVLKFILNQTPSFSNEIFFINSKRKFKGDSLNNDDKNLENFEVVNKSEKMVLMFEKL